MTIRTRVAGPMAVEGEPTGDGRMFEHGALTWDGVLPIPIVFDILDGDHTAPTIGAIEEVFRHDDGVIWGEGYVEDSTVPQVQEWVDRAKEILAQGAVGVSVRVDSETVELRVKRELMDEVEMEPLLDSEGERFVVAKFSRDDALEVITAGRLRHLAIVDTAAIVVDSNNRFGLVASGAIAAAGVFEEWHGKEHFFGNPKFGDYSTDTRLRYDPDRSTWSCPPTLIEDGPEAGRVFGHITPMGICLRGRPDRCVTPPDGDLEGFMRGRAPAAGGLRTGVICVGGSHCGVGIGAAEATMFYDQTGRAIADVRVGKDQYGIWFSGMVRPGASKEDLYAFAASDVSGHWEYTKTGRMTLVGLPAVNVGGFPKGYLTYNEFRNGLAASAGITIEEGCGTWTSVQTEELSIEIESDLMARLGRIELAVGEMYAAHLRNMEGTNAR